MRILVVDDEPELSAQLRETLTEQNYDVDTACDGDEAVDRIYQQAYDLVILDIMLPKRDGLSVLKEMRTERIDTPVLMLTAKASIDDRVRGLDYGADDYLPKPFSMAELLARVRSLLRRLGDVRDPVLRVGRIALDTRSRQVMVDNRPAELTPKEFSILEFLLYNKSRVISRYTLAEHVWGDEFDPFSMSNFIDVHIRNLRRKIGCTQQNRVIKTVRGVGFLIGDDPS